MPTLTIQDGERAGEVFAFETPIVIGRGKKADVALDDPSTSRRHATIEPYGVAWRITDLESANGTLVNGRPVSRPVTVRPGDLITVGKAVFRYDEREAPRETGSDTMYCVEAPSNTRIVLTEPVDPAVAAVAADTQQTGLLYRLAEILGKAFDERTLLDFVLVELLGAVPRAERGLILIRDEATGQLTPRTARTRTGKPPAMTYSRTILDNALRKREGLVIVDAAQEAKLTGAESMFMFGIRSIIAVPIAFRDDVFGVVQLDSIPTGAPFERTELTKAVALAAQVGMALAYVRMHARELQRELLERDLALARRVQQDFLPQRAPELPGYAFGVEYTPALAVGGDFYDFLELAPDRVAIVLGDVSGKGVSAALFAARVTSDLRHQSVGETGPSAVLGRVNRALAFASRDGMFATTVAAVLDTTSAALTIASAGHLAPVLRSANGDARLITLTSGPPLGISQRAKFPEVPHPLAPGESILLYSDGVTESVDEQDEQFGPERLLETVRGAGRSVRDIVRAVRDEVARFSGSRPPRDDLTLVCFGRE
jgi:serine phosphatase RsbU (regulator of sigma subunit)